MKPFSFTLLTPTKTVYEGDILSVVFPTEEGEIGLLRGREDCLIAVKAGPFRYRENGDEWTLAESLGGMAEMRGGELTFCTEGAWLLSEREVASKRREEEIERERERGEQSLMDYKLSQGAMSKAFDKLRRSRHNNR